MAHRSRPVHRAAHPVHVTVRARAGLPPFREEALSRAMRAAIAAASRSPAVGDAFRVVQFSIQSNHVHLLVEASDASVLSRGMQGLNIRLARAINRTLGGRGGVWRERFHARSLRSPREVRNALVYVLMNARKHGYRLSVGVDRFSSAPWFDGFTEPPDQPVTERPVFAARTWLAGVGWRRCGRIRRNEHPRAI